MRNSRCEMTHLRGALRIALNWAATTAGEKLFHLTPGKLFESTASSLIPPLHSEQGKAVKVKKKAAS